MPISKHNPQLTAGTYRAASKKIVDLPMYDAMCQAIEKAHRVDDVKDIRDKAVALAAYAREARNLEAEERCRVIRLRAERRAGQLLHEVPPATPSGANQHKKDVSPSTTHPRLVDLGITRNQASDWKRMAAMPPRDFERAIGTRASTKSIVAATKPSPPKPAYSTRALWLWGRLRDFENDGWFDISAPTIFDEMTSDMSKEV